MSLYISVYILLLYVYISIAAPTALRMNAFSGVRSLVLCNAVISTEATWVPEGGGRILSLPPPPAEFSLCNSTKCIYIYFR